MRNQVLVSLTCDHICKMSFSLRQLNIVFLFFQQHQEDHKFKKNIQKLINANLEKEIKGKAKNFDPKAFEVIDKEAGASGSKE